MKPCKVAGLINGHSHGATFLSWDDLLTIHDGSTARGEGDTGDFLVVRVTDKEALGEVRLADVFEQIVAINKERGITILLVEQNANLALKVSSYGYVLETGRVLLEDSAESLRSNPQVREAYLGE